MSEHIHLYHLLSDDEKQMLKDTPHGEEYSEAFKGLRQKYFPKINSEFSELHPDNQRRIKEFYYFIPADTKGFPKGKFEGSGEAGVIAGYNMSPGYVWDGEYLCWSLKELADINMMAKASKHPPGLQNPHVTMKIPLPTGST